MSTTSGLIAARGTPTTSSSVGTSNTFQSHFDSLKTVFESKRTLPFEWRMKQLQQLEKMLLEKCDDIIAAIKKDLSRPTSQAFLGDVATILGECRFAIQHLKEWMKPEPQPHPLQLKPGHSLVVKQPKGIALVIGAWNFPFHVTLIPIIGAIAAGCCAIIKPSEVAPASAQLMQELFTQYMDTACFQVVQGAVAETTALLALPFNHIFYTGNGAVAQVVMEAAAKHLTPVTLELGGKSPVIVDKSANLQVAARRVIDAKFCNAGQVCIAPDYVLCHKDIQSEFEKLLVKNVHQMFGSDPRQSESFGRIINTRHWDRVATLINNSDGVVVTGGTVKAVKDEKYIPPTIIRDVSPSNKLMQEEIFGPVLPFLTISNIDEAVDFINARDRPLALYVFTEDTKVSDYVINNTWSGGVCVNDAIYHSSNPHLPFGGIGPSGLGAYHGKRSFDTFSHEKAVMVRGTWLDPAARYAPYTEVNYRRLRGLLLGPLIPPAVKAIAKLALVVVAGLVLNRWKHLFL